MRKLLATSMILMLCFGVTVVPVVQAEKDVAQQKLEVTSEEQVDKIAIGDKPVRIGEFLTFSNNILYDKKENLEWMVGEDKNTSHYNSKKYIHAEIGSRLHICP